jgi:hypothetical protein
MSLTSYRAAPPRGSGIKAVEGEEGGECGPGGDLLFRRWRGSTIGAEGFHGRVRDGIGCWAPRYGHQAGNCLSPRRRGGLSCDKRKCLLEDCAIGIAPGSCRYARRCPAEGCSAGDQASVERLVPVSCAGCPASTSGLSTWWSSTALKRDLVLRRVSRLDAFSGYPVRT